MSEYERMNELIERKIVLMKRIARGTANRAAYSEIGKIDSEIAGIHLMRISSHIASKALQTQDQSEGGVE